MSRTTRALAISLVFAFAAAALAQTTLSFWSWRTEDVAAYEKFIAAFHAENPDVDVTFTPYLNTEYNTIVSTALQGGGGPDIVHLRAYGGMEPFAQAGLLVRLDDKVPALADFDPGILLGATNRADGGVYGVPFALQTVQVLYNVDMFERLGLEEPTTWAELLAVGDALKASGVYAFANGTKDGWTNETLFGAVGPTFYGGTPFFQDDHRRGDRLHRPALRRRARAHGGAAAVPGRELHGRRLHRHADPVRVRAGRHVRRRLVRARQHGAAEPASCASAPSRCLPTTPRPPAPSASTSTARTASTPTARTRRPRCASSSSWPARSSARCSPTSCSRSRPCPARSRPARRSPAWSR